MIIESSNFPSSFGLFLAISLSCIFFLALFYFKRERLKKKYFLLFDQGKYFYIKYIFLFLSLFVLLFYFFWIKINQKKLDYTPQWIDIIFILDVSKSMNSLDYKDWNMLVSRLSFSKNIIASYVEKNPKNRYGLVIFAWDANSLLPLTDYHEILLNFLDSIDYKNIWGQWSEIEKSLSLAYNRFKLDEDNPKAIILISDWWDEENNFSIIEKLKGESISWLIVWVWNKKGSRIPLDRDIFWNLVYQKYKWEYVVTRLNEKKLKDISSFLGFDYLNASSKDIYSILEKSFWNLEKNSTKKKIWENALDIWRILSIVSMFFFLFYLFFNFIKKWKE